jgi:hypothetical protein
MSVMLSRLKKNARLPAARRPARCGHPWVGAAGGALLLLTVGTSAAPRGFVGDTGSGWSSTSAVSARAGSEHAGGGRLAVDAINGSGIDAGGDVHGNSPGDMWMSLDPAAADRFGVVPGGHWIEFAFDRAYELKEMWIWNYAEGDPGGYAWSAQGIREATIAYTTVDGPGGWGSLNPNDWTQVFAGEFDVYDPGQPRTPNAVIDFNRAFAKYVLITSSAVASNLNWVCEKAPSSCPNDDAGLSEVRFYPGPDPVPHVEMGVNDAVALSIRSVEGRKHRLERSAVLTPPDWNDTGVYVRGDGAVLELIDPSGASSRAFYRIAVE